MMKPKTMNDLWKCNYCGEQEGVTNGVCPTCGPTQTYPVNADAKKVAKVDAESIKANEKEQALEAVRAKEAEERNQKSIELSQKK